jgi:hypothetical protein
LTRDAHQLTPEVRQQREDVFMYLKHVITAGILSAALALGPGAAFAQTSGSSPSSDTQSSGSQTSGSQDTSSQGSTTQGSTSSGTASSSSNQQSGTGGSDQEAVRQHLTGAREALAELTKLPAASQLQGDQRQRIAQFISDFNAFATATTDWRSKYEAVDRELDQLIGLDTATGTAGSASTAPSTAGVSGTPSESTTPPSDPNASASSSASGAVGTGGAAAEAGDLDPTIVAKLREVRTHLDQFEEASGDPTFVVEKIEKILDQAAGGASASGAVGTSGSDTAAGGSITLSASQVQELRRQLDLIKAAAKR